MRDHEGPRFLAALNFGHKKQSVRLEDGLRGRIALSTHLDREGEKVAGTLALRADEGVLVRLE
jgi:alpha-glucosidase